MAPKIALIIAHKNYQPTEYSVPKKIFQEAGFEVITVSDKAGTAKAKNGSTTTVDITLDKLKVLDYQAIVFVGGSGAMDFIDNNMSHAKIQEAVMNNICVAAICIAPRILAKAGALVSKRATGWNDDEQLEELWRKHGVIMADEDEQVVTDGLIVTATGPQVADIFAHAILKLIG